ncbi:predicted protein [Aspergillus terreus NIH2624]|uniref:Serine hydrolase domain-containing protein n=1 Tax=Aspergillus terreus (strain NIH 2624 / FGSC A1156) TaxID=341663 RepID=Q0CZT5_ASPTN|nr:uncharacterized protein ATEG_00799 [Aspergillus terreus NIH2624]EAU39445.1 predicted protein [Aspergillus terreus NIH2624]
MGVTGNIVPSASAASSANKPVKILMMHGNGSSGSRLDYKTRHLQPLIRDAIKQRTNQNVEFFFPNAPFLPTGFDEDSFTWGLGDYRMSRVPGLDKSVAFLLSYLEEHGPFDGIIGSSAGCCVAVALASLLENPDRCAEFSVKTSHPRLRFILAYSGCVMENPCYSSLYSPKVQTPAMFFIGELDSFIPPDLTMRLADCCSNSAVVTFWGTHYIPRFHETNSAAVDFVCRALAGGREEDANNWVDI